jgi:hypothetical protein
MTRQSAGGTACPTQAKSCSKGVGGAGGFACNFMNGLAKRMTPRVLASMCASLLVLLAALTIAQANPVVILLIRLISPLIAYGIAMWLCGEIAREYRSSKDLRRAWVVLGVCAGVSMLRHLFDTPLVDLVWPGYWAGPWSQLMRELLAAAALTLLAAGILTMAEAFRRMRLGFSLHWPDLAAMAGVLLLLALVLYFRNDLSAARVSVSLAKRAQLFSQVMFAIAAAGCVLLMRISKQMGGGKLAIAMGWIIAHIVLRAALVLATAWQAHLNKSLPSVNLTFLLLSNAAIWMFAMAAASRYQVSVTAAQQAAKWGVVPNGRLADVAG